MILQPRNPDGKCGSQDRRWALKGEGLRLPGEESERSGRGQRGRGEASGEVEAPRTLEEGPRGKQVGGWRKGRLWRSDGGGGRQAVKHEAVRIWEACSLGRLRLGRGLDPKKGSYCSKFRIHKKVC